MVDTVLTLLVNGGSGPVIRDDIGQPTVLVWHRFPYLAAPNLNPRRPRILYKPGHQVTT